MKQQLAGRDVDARADQYSLAATLYDEISQRQYSDLDVFVRKQALPRVDELESGDNG